MQETEINRLNKICLGVKIIGCRIMDREKEGERMELDCYMRWDYWREWWVEGWGNGVEKRMDVEWEWWLEVGDNNCLDNEWRRRERE